MRLTPEKIPEVFKEAHIIAECFDRADQKQMLVETVGEIQRSSIKLQKDIDSGERVIVGVNKYVEEEEEVSEEQYLHIDDDIDEQQRQKLEMIKSGRDNADVKKALSRLEDSINAGDNLMPPIIEAVKCYATLGEICGVMRNQWGEFRAPSIL